MAERSKVDHVEARRFADQVLRYPVPLDRVRVEALARAYMELASAARGGAQNDTNQT